MIDNIRKTAARLLPAGSFTRNVFTLMTGTTFAQALSILVAPILTRLYTPADFGIFALYSSVLGIIAVVACWRYEVAIVIPEKDEDAANLLALAVLICIGMTILTLLLVVFLGGYIAGLVSAPELAPWLWFMPLSMLAAGLFQAFNYWSTRRKQFKRLAARTVAQSIVGAVSQIGLRGIYPSAGSGGLIGGSIVGQIVATGRLAWQIGKDEGNFIRGCLNPQNLSRVIVDYRNYPLYGSWSVFLNSASALLPALLLGHFFAPAIVGYYALGQRVLSLPMGVIGGSIAQVFFPRAMEGRRTGDLGRLTVDIFQRMLAIGFVPILLITVVAPDLFALVFGSQWRIAGDYVRWMSLWMLFVFISSPLSSIFLIMDKQRQGLIANILIFILRLTILIVGGLYANPLVTIAVFGMVGAMMWMANCIYIQYLAGISPATTIMIIGRQFALGLPYALLPIGVHFITSNSVAFVSAGIGAGIIFCLVQGCRIKKTGAWI